MSYGGYQQGGGYPQGGGYQPGNSFPPPQQYGYGAPPMQYADMGKRFVAAIIDGLVIMVGEIPGIIVMIIGGALGAAAAPSGSVSDEAAGAFVFFVFLGIILLIVGAIAVWLYNIYLLGRDGATFGKRFMKIKVLDPQGRPLGFGKAFLRELVKGLVGQVCVVLSFWPLWDPEKQGLQDKIFSTHVYNA